MNVNSKKYKSLAETNKNYSSKYSKKYYSAPTIMIHGYNNTINNINPKNVIEKRISNHERVNEYLNQDNLLNIKGCLVYDNSKLYIRNRNYEFILSDKPITKGGSFGIAYSVTNEIILNTTIEKFKYALKIQIDTEEANNEIYILNELTNKLISDKNIHLPVIYANFKCNNLEYVENSLFPEIIKKHKASYNISMVELGKGDFKQFVTNDGLTNELFVNAVAQIFMCILSLHKYGVAHYDTHWGNFLYFKIKPGGYIRYVIDGTDYYLENLGYIWISWDFGISHKLYRNSDYIYDYGLFSLFLRHYTPNHKSCLYELGIIDENGFLSEDYFNFRYFGNLPENVKIPENIVNVDKYIQSVMTNSVVRDGGKFENNQSEISFMDKIKIQKTLFPTISEKELIINIIQRLNVFKSDISTDQIISTIVFDNLIDEPKFNIVAYKNDKITKKVIKDPEAGTQHFIDFM